VKGYARHNDYICDALKSFRSSVLHFGYVRTAGGRVWDGEVGQNAGRVAAGKAARADRAALATAPCRAPAPVEVRTRAQRLHWTAGSHARRGV